MAEAVRDQNHVPSLLATLDSDGVTPVAVTATPGHRLRVSDGTTGSDNGPEDAERDQNHVTSLLAVSSVDGVTPVVVYANSEGKLLVQTT